MNNKDSNWNRLKYIAISIFVVLFGFVCSMSLGNDSAENDTLGDCPIPMIQNIYGSSDVQVTEVFLCEGIDETGIPINRMPSGKSTEWEKISLCVFVTTTEPSSLSAYWLYEDGLEFTGRGVFEHVFKDGFVTFSLEKAAACTVNESNWAFPNYLADEMEAGYIPAGQYHVEIHQGRKIIGQFSFMVED